MIFCRGIVAKYINKVTNFINSIWRHVMNPTCNKQKPHDHIFQKSGQRVNPLLSKKKLAEIYWKVIFCRGIISEIHFQYYKLNRFHLITWHTSHLDQTETPWPFISKVTALSQPAFKHKIRQRYIKWYFVVDIMRNTLTVL